MSDTVKRGHEGRVAQTVEAAPDTMRKTGPVRIGSETILVVEDEPSLRNLAYSVLLSRMTITAACALMQPLPSV